ncbi:unnamed protein product, partial [Mycena citricolor]
FASDRVFHLELYLLHKLAKCPARGICSHGNKSTRTRCHRKHLQRPSSCPRSFSNGAMRSTLRLRIQLAACSELSISGIASFS